MTQSSATMTRELGRCLVTGATGFVGSSLAITLSKKGINVRGLVRNSGSEKARELAEAGVELHSGDVTQPETLAQAVRDIDTVFHAAAVLGPANLDPKVYRAVNAGGTSAMIAACRSDGGVKRFVHLSTVGVLGPLPEKVRADEGCPPKPEDIYEVTKLEAEELVLDAIRNDRFPAVIVRPGWVYGPGDTRTYRLFRMIARKRFMVIGKALNRQHPIHVEDLVAGILLAAMVTEAEGRVYHLCGPEIITVNELCAEVAEAAGVRLFPFHPPVWTVREPARMIGKIWSLFGADPPVDHRKADFFTIHRAYSIQRAKDELGWVPEIRFADGIRRTIAWYRERKML